MGIERIAEFEKLEKEDYIKAFLEKRENCYPDKEIATKTASDWYNNITIPVRATMGSAGYDFVIPFDVVIKPGCTCLVLTGIRCKIDEGWVLSIYPRSGLGFKYRCQLDNTVGIIDQDYYYSDNKGHIMIKITNDSKENKDMILKAGDRFAQGVFTRYGITYSDNVTNIRNGGIGSSSDICSITRNIIRSSDISSIPNKR